MVVDKFDKDTLTGPLKVMISGPPAAGKGTQCERIVKKVKRSFEKVAHHSRQGTQSIS